MLDHRRRLFIDLGQRMVRPAGTRWAVTINNYGCLRPGVQILAPRFRKGLCLEAGEVIEGPRVLSRRSMPCSDAWRRSKGNQPPASRYEQPAHAERSDFTI